MKKFSSLLTMLFQFISVILSIGCHSGSPVSPPSVLPASDIVFARDGHLYIMRNEDSLNILPLVDTTSSFMANSILEPKLSPDRELIAFYATKSFTDLRTMLWVVRVDGKNLHPITVVALLNQLLIAGFNWSPDGQRIAFSSPKDGTNNANNIYIVNADGTGEHAITHDDCLNINPQWSYDGKYIAFDRTHRYGTLGFGVYDLLSGKMVEMANSAEHRWSPNSNRLAYTAPSENPVNRLSKDLFTTEFDGSTFTHTVKLSGSAYSGTYTWIWGGWDPSGNSILVCTSNDTVAPIQNAEVLLADSENGNSKLIMNIELPGKATWSNNGTRIFFTKIRPDWHPGGGFDLWVVNSDGSGQKLLIQNIEDPDW